MPRHLAFLGLALPLVVACGSDSVSAPGNLPPSMPFSSQVATVVVSPPTASITVGDTLRASAATLDAGGSPLLGRVVAWSSDVAATATVSSTGLVTAVAAGSVRISALSEGRTGSATITVRAR